MGHIAHQRTLFKSMNTFERSYDYITNNDYIMNNYDYINNKIGLVVQE